jgi:pantoate--beta-alanine ligase
MELVTAPNAMQQIALRLRREGRRIGLVPTMGYLHEGHLSLVRDARKRSDITVVSVFVNPAQFGPNEDFHRYPRDLERDKRLCGAEGVDYLFAPGEADVYPPQYSTHVVEEALSRHLEAATRPTHFRGVSTVVAKLFHIVQPDLAVFGQKDAQQAAIIKRMVRDLNFPVELVIAPIAREPDGLAMSSRNSYLTPDERKQATVLHRALLWAVEAWRKGETESLELRKGMAKIILYAPQAKVDYIEFVNPDTFAIVPTVHKETLIVLAVSFGKTRLIDNAVVE